MRTSDMTVMLVFVVATMTYGKVVQAQGKAITVTAMYCENPAAADPEKIYEYPQWDKDVKGNQIAPPPAELLLLGKYNDSSILIRGTESQTAWSKPTLLVFRGNGKAETPKRYSDEFLWYDTNSKIYIKPLLITKSEAEHICEKLVNICTTRFGDRYQFVGAGRFRTFVPGNHSISFLTGTDQNFSNKEIYTCSTRQKGIASGELSGDKSRYDVTCLDRQRFALFVRDKTNRHEWIKEPDKVKYYTRTDVQLKTELDDQLGLRYCTDE